MSVAGSSSAGARPGPPWERLDAALTRVNACVVSAALVALTLDVLVGVGTRFVLGNQARWTEELARLLLVWVALLGGALAYSRDDHLGLDLVVSRMDAATSGLCRRVGAGFVYLLAVGLMVVGGAGVYAERIAFGQTMPALGIGRSWQYLPVPIAGVLIAVSAVRRMLEASHTLEDRTREAAAGMPGGGEP